MMEPSSQQVREKCRRGFGLQEANLRLPQVPGQAGRHERIVDLHRQKSSHQTLNWPQD
jgi:hypothetical protein